MIYLNEVRISSSVEACRSFYEDALSQGIDAAKVGQVVGRIVAERHGLDDGEKQSVLNQLTEAGVLLRDEQSHLDR